MCLSGEGLYGHLDATKRDWLMEWIETNRLPGISHFYLSNASATVDQSVANLISYYEQNITQHPPPLLSVNNKILENNNNKTYTTLTAHTGRNDFLYRNMYRHWFIAILDIDKIIIP